MLSITGWWLVLEPADLRCGMDRLWLLVQQLRGRAPAEGEAYVFGNRSGTRIKLLCCDRHGVWLAVRRLQQGRFIWPHRGDSVWNLSHEQFNWLCMGVDWRRLSGPLETSKTVL